MLNLLPAKVIQSYESFLAVWGFFALVVTLIVAAAKKLILWLGSQKRENKLFDRYYKKYLNDLK